MFAKVSHFISTVGIIDGVTMMKMTYLSILLYSKKSVHHLVHMLIIE